MPHIYLRIRLRKFLPGTVNDRTMREDEPLFEEQRMLNDAYIKDVQKSRSLRFEQLLPSLFIFPYGR